MARKLKLGGHLAKKAVTLLDARRTKVAVAVARQMQRSVPSYADIDVVALARGNEDTLECLGDLLMERKTKSLERITYSVAELRAAAGFDVSDFVSAGLCFLPVIRRYLTKAADTVQEGLEMYELVEAMLMPFTGTMLKIFMECMPKEGEDHTKPEGIDSKRFLKLLSDSLERSKDGLGGLEPLPLASLDGDPFGLDDEADGDVTLKGRGLKK
jgi:hypothetical protein